MRPVANKAVLYLVTDPEPGKPSMLTIPLYVADNGHVDAYWTDGSITSYETTALAEGLIRERAKVLGLGPGETSIVDRSKAVEMRVEKLPGLVTTPQLYESLSAMSNLIPLDDGLIAVTLVLGKSAMEKVARCHGSGGDPLYMERDAEDDAYMEKYRRQAGDLIIKAIAAGAFEFLPVPDDGEEPLFASV